MRGWLKWTVLTALVAIHVVAGLVYWLGGEVLSRQYPSTARSLPVSTDPEVLARGESLAALYGCYRGCHGRSMQGAIIDEGLLVGRLVSPNLTATIRERSLTAIEAIVRQGVKPDGSSVFHMPSAGYATMTDEDFIAITSFIRAYPIQVEQQPSTKFGLSSRAALITGHLAPQAAMVLDEPWREGFRSEPRRLGEYLVRNACVECHGTDPSTGVGEVPPLDRVRQYDQWEFVGFMQTGQPLGAELSVEKSRMARERFASLTEDEIEAIYTYLAAY